MGNFPGRSPKASAVNLNSVMVAIISFVCKFSDSGYGLKSSSKDCCVRCRFILSWLRCPKWVGIVGCKNFVTDKVVKPGHDWTLPFFMAFMKVAFAGEKQAAW